MLKEDGSSENQPFEKKTNNHQQKNSTVFIRSKLVVTELRPEEGSVDLLECLFFLVTSLA